MIAAKQNLQTEGLTVRKTSLNNFDQRYLTFLLYCFRKRGAEILYNKLQESKWDYLVDLLRILEFCVLENALELKKKRFPPKKRIQNNHEVYLTILRYWQ